MKAYKPGAGSVSEKADESKEVRKPLEVQTATEAAQRGGVIDDNNNQARWAKAQQVHDIGDESATGMFYKRGEARPETEKFQLVDSQAAKSHSAVSEEKAQTEPARRREKAAELSPQMKAEREQRAKLWQQIGVPGTEQAAWRPVLGADVLKAREYQSHNDQEDTGTLIVREAKKNPVAEPVAAGWKWANDLPPGQQKDSFKQLVREQAAELSPEMKATLEKREQTRRGADEPDQQNAGSFNVQELTAKANLEGYATQTDAKQSEWLAFAKLPKDEQQKVIEMLEKCPELITSDYEKQQEAIARAIPKGLMNLGQHTIEAVLGVGRAAGAVMEYCEAAKVDPVGTREKAVKAIGEGLEVGVNVFSRTDDYLQAVGGAAAYGDGGKAFRDVAWLGQEIDRRWQSRSEAQKIEIATELTAGCLLPGAAARLARSEKLTTAIAELSRVTGPENRQKFNQGVEKVLDSVLARVQDELKTQPLVRTPEGFLVPVPVREIEQVKDSGGLADHIMEMAQVFGLGNKYPLKNSELVQRYGLTKKEVLNKTEAELEALRLERIAEGYRIAFYKAYPHLRNTQLEVHHALPQTLLDRHPGLFKAREIHSLEYLSGIPKAAMHNGKDVHDLITASWNRFLKNNTHPTRQQVLEHMRQLDEEYGQYFVPPLKKGSR